MESLELTGKKTSTPNSNSEPLILEVLGQLVALEAHLIKTYQQAFQSGALPDAESAIRENLTQAFKRYDAAENAWRDLDQNPVEIQQKFNLSASTELLLRLHSLETLSRLLGDALRAIYPLTPQTHASELVRDMFTQIETTSENFSTTAQLKAEISKRLISSREL